MYGNCSFFHWNKIFFKYLLYKFFSDFISFFMCALHLMAVILLGQKKIDPGFFFKGRRQKDIITLLFVKTRVMIHNFSQ